MHTEAWNHVSLLTLLLNFISEEEEFSSTLRDRSHIDETLRLASEEKAADFAGEEGKKD